MDKRLAVIKETWEATDENITSSYTDRSLNACKETMSKSPLMNSELFYHILSFLYDTEASHSTKSHLHDHSQKCLPLNENYCLSLPASANIDVNEDNHDTHQEKRNKNNDTNNNLNYDNLTSESENKCAEIFTQKTFLDEKENESNCIMKTDILNDFESNNKYDDSLMTSYTSGTLRLSPGDEDLNLMTNVKLVCKQWNILLSTPGFFKYVGATLKTVVEGNFNFSLMTKIKRHCNGSEGMCYKVKYLLDQKEYCLKIGKGQCKEEGLPYFFLRSTAALMELQNLSPTNLSRLIFAHVYRDRIYTIFHYYEYNLGYYLKLVREEKGHICNMEEDRTLESDRDNDEVSIYSFDSDSDTEDSYGQENYSSPTMMKVEEVNEMGYKSDEGVEYCDSEICALPAVQIISLVKQLLTAVNICHSRGIIHRNIKPKHILVQPGPNSNNPLENATLKLSDFALVKNIGLLQRTSTMEVVTLWYRAPEILLGRDSYNSELDMWSVGCVIAEICRLKPLWMGRGRMDQLLQIFSTLSSPSLSIEHKMKTKASTLSLPRSDTKSMPIPGKDGNLCGGIASVEKARDKVENYDNTFTSNFTSDKSPFTSNVSTKIDGIDMNLEYNSYPGFYDLPKVSNYHKYALNEKIRKWHKFDRNRLGEFLPRNIPVDLYRTILLCFRYDPYERISAEELLDIFHSTFSESNPIPDSLTTKACQKKYLIPKDFNPSVIYENVRSIQPSSLNSVSFQESIANSSVVFAKGIFSRNTRINVHNQSKPSVCVTNTPCIRTFTPNLFELNSRSKDYSSLSPGGSISKVAIQSRTYQEGKSCLNEFKLKLVNDIEKITTCKSSGKYFGHLIESEKDNIEQLIKVFQAHRIEGASSTIIKCHFECLFNLMQQFLTYRPILVVWILDIAVTYNLETRTIQLAICFIDRFILQKFIHIVLKEEETLSKPETKEGNKYDFRSIIRGINFWKEIDKAKLLLVSVAALHTASKIEDVSYIGIDDLVKHAQTSMILWGHQSFFQLYQIQERNVIDFRNEALEEETENEAMEPEINLLGDETLSATNNFLALEIDSTKCLDIEEYLVQELSFRLSGPTFVDYLTVYMTILANFDFFSIKAKLFNFEALSRRKNGAYTSNESNGEICKNKFIVCDEIIHLVRYLGNICIIYFPFAFFLNLLCSNNEQECQCKKYHFSDLASRNIAIILRKIITRGESYSGNSVFFCCLLISCYISMFSSSSSQFQDYRFSCISNLRIFRITTHYLLETYFHLEGYYNPYSALVIDRKAHISTLVTIVRKLYSLHELQILPEERRNTFHRFTRERDYEENLAEALHIVHKQHESDDFNRVANFVWPNVEELVNYIEEEFSYDFGF